MLVGFSVGNFRSFHDPQYCGFIASCDDAHEVTHCVDTGIKALPRLTRTAVIFGPNAGGKSNLLLALRTMRDLVLHSTSFTSEEFAATYTPCRLSDSQRRPTVFGIDLLLLGVRYHYSFAYDAAGIVSESLHVHRSRKSQRWFGRQRDPGGMESWAPFSPSMNGPREAWRKETHARALFLSTAGRHAAPQLRELFHWFERACVVLCGEEDTGVLAARLARADFKPRLLDILQAMDVRIDDMRVRPTTFGHGIQCLHRRDGAAPLWLDFDHEAAGVRRLIHLLGPLLDALNHGTFIAIDELNRSLHPLAVRFLLRMIHDSRGARASTQLMTSTHNTGLMDLDILRRDEIWLMALDERHASRLSSLLEQSPRKHEKVAKNYLRGRFGAIPLIGLDPGAAGIHPESD